MRLFEFKSPTEKDVATRLKEIAQAENIKATDDDLLKMARDSSVQGDYDIRKVCRQSREIPGTGSWTGNDEKVNCRDTNIHLGGVRG